MFLSFTIVDEYGLTRDFSWWFTSLEFALDVMSSLAVKGKQIAKAELIDDDHLIQLPVDSFDGKLFSSPIKQLESEWQQLLNAPVNQRSVLDELTDRASNDFDLPPFNELTWALTTVKFED
ncbi:hypothetical protein GCM10028818_16930 [Spirosoma horti]